MGRGVGSRETESCQSWSDQQLTQLYGTLAGSILKHYITLSILNVELSVRDDKDVALKRAFSCVSFDFQLDPFWGVDEAGAAAMHFLTGHRAQIDQKPKLIFGV